jgi:hypothetical protein
VLASTRRTLQYRYSSCSYLGLRGGAYLGLAAGAKVVVLQESKQSSKTKEFRKYMCFVGLERGNWLEGKRQYKKLLE